MPVLLFRGAGPWPFVWRPYKASLDWIILNVVADFFAFGGGPYPMIKGFGLPEDTARTLQNSIGVTSAHTFDATRNPFERQVGLDRQMDVVGHDDVRKDRVLAQVMSASEDAGLQALCDVRILEPQRPKA